MLKHRKYSIDLPISKNISYLLLMFLFSLNFIFRIPFVSHERAGYDSYGNHSLAFSIGQNGYANWLLNPLSYFGLYPYSYPSGNAFLIASISQITLLNIENSILLLDFLLCLFSIVSSWSLAKLITNNPFSIFLVSFIFSMMPKIIEYTYWLGSARGTFALLAPFFWILLFLSIKIRSKYIKIIMISLITIFIIICLSIHRSAILFFPIILSSFIVLLYNKYIRPSLKHKQLFNNYLYRITFFFILIIITLTFQQLFLNSIINIQIGQGDFAKGGYVKGLPLQIGFYINLLISYTGRSGPFLLISFFGIIELLKNFKKNMFVEILFANLLIIIPIMSYSEYVSLILFPVLSIIIAFGIINLLKRIQFSKLLIGIMIIFIIITSCIFSQYMVNYWGNQQLGNTSYTWLQKDKTFETAVFIKEFPDNRSVNVPGHVPGYIAVAYSGTEDPIPIPDSYEIKQKNLLEYLKHPQEPYTVQYYFNEPKEYSYYFEDIQYYGKTTYYYIEIKQSNYATNVHNHNYLLYSNSENLLWYVG